MISRASSRARRASGSARLSAARSNVSAFWDLPDFTRSIALSTTGSRDVNASEAPVGSAAGLLEIEAASATIRPAGRSRLRFICGFGLGEDMGTDGAVYGLRAQVHGCPLPRSLCSRSPRGRGLLARVEGLRRIRNQAWLLASTKPEGGATSLLPHFPLAFCRRLGHFPQIGR